MKFLGFTRYANGWSWGRNDSQHWYVSVHRRSRAARAYAEWHNYPEHTATLFFNVGIASPTVHRWWATDFTVWPPEQGRLAQLTRRFPAKRWWR